MSYSTNIEKNPRTQDIEDNWERIYIPLRIARHYEVRDMLLEVKKRDFPLANALYHRIDEWLKSYCGRGGPTENELKAGLDPYEIGPDRFNRIIRERANGIWEIDDLPWIMPKVFSNDPR